MILLNFHCPLGSEERDFLRYPQTATNQTARNLKTILSWQQQLYDKSEVHGYPLVWYFNNIGANWKVYASTYAPAQLTQPSMIRCDNLECKLD